MGIAAQPPKGGIVAELGGKSRPLLLRNAEIERFEDLHGVGIFTILDQVTVGRGIPVQARHIRDLVALGLVGGGMPDRAADGIVSSLPPAENLRLRQIALDLIVVAFTPESPGKKKATGASSKPSRVKTTSGASQKESEASSPSA